MAQKFHIEVPQKRSHTSLQRNGVVCGIEVLQPNLVSASRGCDLEHIVEYLQQEKKYLSTHE